MYFYWWTGDGVFDGGEENKMLERKYLNLMFCHQVKSHIMIRKQEFRKIFLYRYE